MEKIDFDKLEIKIRQKCQEQLLMSDNQEDEKLWDIIEDELLVVTENYYYPLANRANLIQRIFNSMRRFDNLQPLLDDSSVSEIMINGPDNVFIEREGKVTTCDFNFGNSDRLENLIHSIVGKVNRTVNEASPIVDARLQDGSRVNVVMPPIALNGPILTIRKFPEKELGIDELIARGTLTEEVAEFLHKLIIGKYNLFISGGTGSGKTTLLNALSGFIPEDERIITIEDSAELKIRNVKNLVRLETRNSNTEGRGAISIKELIRSSLRMRPDRIIVGEIRGAEALDMLAAMNTGHDGSLSTGHANSCEDMMKRIETMVLEGANFPLQAIKGQIATAIDIMIHVSRLRDKSRKITEICEVIGFVDGEIKLKTLYEFIETGDLDGIIQGTLTSKDRLSNKIKLKLAGINYE